MTFDVSMNTVATTLVCAAIVGAFKLGLSTALVLRELKGEFNGHKVVDAEAHERIGKLEDRLVA